jgi:hypothetical protein
MRTTFPKREWFVRAPKHVQKGARQMRVRPIFHMHAVIVSRCMVSPTRVCRSNMPPFAKPVLGAPIDQPWPLFPAVAIVGRMQNKAAAILNCERRQDSLVVASLDRTRVSVADQPSSQARPSRGQPRALPPTTSFSVRCETQHLADDACSQSIS